MEKLVLFSPVRHPRLVEPGFSHEELFVFLRVCLFGLGHEDARRQGRCPNKKGKVHFFSIFNLHKSPILNPQL